MKPSPATKAFTLAILVAAGLAGLILALDPLLDSVPHPPDQGSWWYFWQLSDPTIITRASAWIGYLLHQVSLWVIVVLMMKEKPHPGKLSRLNVAALLANLAFILLHIVQTHVWYDGLAQDVPVWTSQWSVIIMLFIIIYQMTPARGFILGKRIPWSREALALSGKWHGLYISWALVYTFWFHPTEGDFGLLLGFFYMFLLLVQLSFANTEIHFSKGWVALLELMVGLHGPAIAIQKALTADGSAPLSLERFEAGTWIMFLTGFLFMFVFTGQFGLNWPKWARALVFAAYTALTVGLFAWWDLGRAYMVVFIPTALYGCALGYGAILELLVRLRPRRGRDGGTVTA
jgi:hypothetical protein